MKRLLALSCVLSLASSIASCAAEERAVVPPVTTARPAGETPPAVPTVLGAPEWEPVSFRTAINESLEAILIHAPEWATSQGEHRFDDQWSDLTAEGQEKVAAEYQVRAEGLREIAAHSPANADPVEAGTDHPAIDARLLADWLDRLAFEMTGFRALERDPGAVLGQIGSGLSALTSHEFAPKHVRMDAASSRLGKVPDLLKAARARLKSPTRAAMENVAIVAPGLVRMLRGDLGKTDVKDLQGDAPLRDRLHANAESAASAITAYAAELGKTFPLEKLENKPIGDEVWAKMARLREGVTESPAEIRKMGEDEIARLLAELSALRAAPENKGAKKGETGQAFFQRLEADHPRADKVLDEYRQVNRGVEEWMRGHAFVTVPWDKARVEIVQTPPPHNRGVSFASMNAAGPLEASISDARFEVNVPDGQMPASRVAALLAFHAHGAIDGVSVHEALPGHYLQLLHQRESTSKVRRLLWSATAGEGWAHYCEQAVLAAGYTGADGFRTRAFYLRMALQRAARVVVDVAENDGAMSLDQGSKFLEDNAMLAPEAARMEARRAVVWPVYMFTYTYGKLAILRLLAKVKARDGASFDLVRFHDRLLAFGAVPVRYAAPAVFGIDDR